MNKCIAVLAGSIVSFAVTDSHAVNVTASDSTPSFIYDDTDSTGSAEWLTFAFAASDDSAGYWVLREQFNTSQDVFIVYSDGVSSKQYSLVVEENGNMNFAQGLFLNRAGQQLSIGTSSFLADFTISDVQPNIALSDESNNDRMELRLDDSQISLFALPAGSNMRKIMEIPVDAPADSLVIDNTGNITSVGGFLGRGFLAQDFSVDGLPVVGWANDETTLFSTLEDKTLTYGVLFGNTNVYSYNTQAPSGSLAVDAGGNLGLGTLTPVQAVDVERSGAAARFQLTSFTAVAEEAPQYIQRRARGTAAAPAAVQNGDNLGLFSFRGYNGTNMGGSRATITAQAAGNFTGASTPTRLIFATTPVGQTTPQQVLVITPDGKVQVNGQNLSVPDYVFEDDYELMPLEELQAFIDEHGHLPGLPSADEVNSAGLDLAGSQMSLLQKVEELTLYTLQQERQLARQDVENARLRAELADLRSGLEELQRGE